MRDLILQLSKSSIYSTKPSWVSKQVLSALPKDVNIQMGVGSLEGATVPHVQQLHQSLLASGLKSKLSVYTGGHDYAWWRGAIIDGLSDV
ncbi:alpha/beta hydrolase-fold protein, partial [Klebsiella pneumoniae]|nr:alpha/beta hydrolase-fold protein [Klebsiella pneumoniae]